MVDKTQMLSSSQKKNKLMRLDTSDSRYFSYLFSFLLFSFSFPKNNTS